MKKINPCRGRIPNWAKKIVEEQVDKYGFSMAFSYFAYDCDWSDLSDGDVRLWRAFSAYGRAHNIPESPPEAWVI